MRRLQRVDNWIRREPKPGSHAATMDWSAVTWSEVTDSIREAEWSEPPRGLRECLGGRFGLPKGKAKLVSRLKCNAY